MSVQNCLVPPYERPTSTGVVPLSTVQTIGGNKSFTTNPRIQTGIVNDPQVDAEMMTGNFCTNYRQTTVPIDKDGENNDTYSTIWSYTGMNVGWYAFTLTVEISNPVTPVPVYFSYKVVVTDDEGQNITWAANEEMPFVDGAFTTCTGFFQVVRTTDTASFQMESNYVGNVGDTQYNFTYFNLVQL